MRHKARQASAQDKGKQPLHLVRRPGQRRRGRRRLVGGQLRTLPRKSKCLSLRAWASVYLGDCATVFLGDCAIVYLGDCATVCLGDCAIVTLGSSSGCDFGRLGNWYSGSLSSGTLVFGLLCTLGVGL